MKDEPLEARLPFVWPEPRVSAGHGRYASSVPFESAMRSVASIFGVVSAVDRRAVSWIDELLADRAEARLRLVLSIYPTCRTSVDDLDDVLRLTERHGNRAGFRLHPEKSPEDRSANLLCICSTDGSLFIASGPTDNFAFGRTSPSHANVASSVTAATFEACRKWFDYLWGISGKLDHDVAALMPALALPEGDIEAERLWNGFRSRCLASAADESLPPQVDVDPESGEVVLLDDDGNWVASPTDEIGVPKLDAFSESISRLFEQGVLVSIDRLSRIPPLEAPVRPEWFGVDSFRQTGRVRSQTSIKVAPFDESTRKKIDRLRRVSGELLPRFSFSLADGVRWIPKPAIPLFELALTEANSEAKKLLGSAIGGSVESFLTTQYTRIRSDAQRMYEVFHPYGTIPEAAVEKILNELMLRLDKTAADKIIPLVAYSPVAFSAAQSSEWASPWGQAFSLLTGIAEFPRSALTNRFFLQGVRVDEDELLQAMNVADDVLLRGHVTRSLRQRAEIELQLIKQLERAPAGTTEKCIALWTLITKGSDDAVVAIIGTSDGAL